MGLGKKRGGEAVMRCGWWRGQRDEFVKVGSGKLMGRGSGEKNL